MNQKLRRISIVLLVGFSLLFVSSFAQIPSSGVQSSTTSTTSQNSTPSWVFVGAYLNYSVNANLGFGFSLTNGSRMAFTANFTGSVKAEILSISNGDANLTTVPNLSYVEKTTYLNGTTNTVTQTFSAVNASSSLVPLSQINFGGALEQALNSSNSLYSFSPNLNTSLSVNPAEIYQFNSTTKVIALHLSSSVYEQNTISPQLGASGSYSINGTSDSYTTVAQDIPLKESGNLKGSATIQNVPGLVQDISTLQTQSITASGNFDFTLILTSTNINLSSGAANQSVISVPSYSTELDVVSNSTISGASTSGNKLIVNVTGPSGTTGVLDVVVSPSLLNKSGISSVSQVGVTFDGETYTNYTVTPEGGSYLFTVYYHHSSHSIALVFPNANLGSNVGMVSSLSTSGSSTTTPSTMLLIEVAAVVIIVVIVALVIGFMRRGKGKNVATAPAPESSPPAAQT